MRSVLLALCFCAVSAFADDPAPTPSPQTVAPAIAATISTATPPTPATAVAAPAAVSTVQPQAAPHTEPSCDDVKAFKDKVHGAIDAALKYPAELKFRPASGVTIVAFEYQSGQVSDVHITQWSGDGRLDRAAVNAVKNADYASITPGIGSRKIRDSVIIIFDNSANTDKHDAEQKQKKHDLAGQNCL